MNWPSEISRIGITDHRSPVTGFLLGVSQIALSERTIDGLTTSSGVPPWFEGPMVVSTDQGNRPHSRLR